MGVYDQIKQAIQDMVAPALHAMQGELKVLGQKIDGLDARLSTKIDGLDQKIDNLDDRLTTKIDSLRAEILSEIRRVDTRIDGLEREVRTAIDIRERLAALEARRPA